jgi:hypothetical protein
MCTPVVMRTEPGAHRDEAAAIARDVGPAVLACAPDAPAVGFNVSVDRSGVITGGHVEGLSPYEERCIAAAVGSRRAPALGYAYSVEVVVSRE